MNRRKITAAPSENVCGSFFSQLRSQELRIKEPDLLGGLYLIPVGNCAKI